MVSAVTVLEWLTVPLPAPTRPASLPEEPWKMPEQIEFNAKESLVVLNNVSLWGKLADAALVAVPGEPKWNFLGVITRGDERLVILNVENQPEQRLSKGDILPDGSQILHIENDTLCLLHNGQKRNLSIYPQGRLSGTMSASNTADAPVCLETVERSKDKTR